MVRQAEEIAISFWVPWEGVDSVEAEDVVDAKHSEDLGEAAETFAPPCEASFCHGLPVIEGDAPVLAPFVDEGIFCGVTFGWGSAEPMGLEYGAVEKYVCRVEGYADGEVSHEFDPAVVGVGAEIEPLAEAEPLGVGEEVDAGLDLSGIFVVDGGDQVAGSFRIP